MVKFSSAVSEQGPRVGAWQPPPAPMWVTSVGVADDRLRGDEAGAGATRSRPNLLGVGPAPVVGLGSYARRGRYCKGLRDHQHLLRGEPAFGERGAASTAVRGVKGSCLVGPASQPIAASRLRKGSRCRWGDRWECQRGATLRYPRLADNLAAPSWARSVSANRRASSQRVVGTEMLRAATISPV